MAKFWNPEVTNPQKTPFAIISEAAQELSTATKGMLKMVIQDPVVQQGNEVRKVEIHADKLEYVKQLFSITHTVDLVYPVSISAGTTVFQGPTSVKKCNNEPQCEAALRELFASTHVSTIVSSLLARINEAA